MSTAGDPELRFCSHEAPPSFPEVDFSFPFFQYIPLPLSLFGVTMNDLDLVSENECGVNSNNHNATNFLKCFIYVFASFISQEAGSQYVAQTSSNLSSSRVPPASVSLVSGTAQIMRVTMQNS